MSTSTTPEREESPFEKRYNAPVPHHQRHTLGWALQAAAKAMTESRFGDVQREAGQAMRYLTEFVNVLNPSPNLTEAEANWARAAHTYMRKCCDDPVTTLLYNLIARSDGWNVWAAFVKAAVAGEGFQQAVFAAKDVCHTEDNPPNTYMACALEAWNKQAFERMVKAFKQDGWL